MVIKNKDFKNVTKKSLYIDNQNLFKKLKDAIEEINQFKKDEKDDKILIESWGFNNLNEITEFINKYKNHNCMEDGDRIQYEIVRGNNDKNLYKIKNMEKEIILLKEEIIKKDDAITNLTNKYFKLKKNKDYMNNFLKDNKFNSFESLKEFIDKYNKLDIKKEVNKQSGTTDNIVDNIKQDIQNENIVNGIVLKVDSEDNIKEKVLETDIKNLDENTQAQSTSNNDSHNVNNLENKIHDDRENNKNIKYREDYNIPIIIYDKTDDKIIKKVSEEFGNILKYNYIINEDILKENNENIINNIANYINKNEVKLNDYVGKSKYRIKNKIIRCHFLYNKYKEKIFRIKFSLSKISDISNKNWKGWLEYLDKIINSIDFDDKINNIDNKENIKDKNKDIIDIKVNNNIEPSKPIHVDEKIKINIDLQNKIEEDELDDDDDNLCNICFENTIEYEDDSACNECFKNMI